MKAATLPFGFNVFTGRANPNAGVVAAESNLLGTYFWSSDNPAEVANMRPAQAGVDCPICHGPLTTIEPVPTVGGRAVDYNPTTGTVLVAPFPPHVRPLHCDGCLVYFVDYAR